MSAHRVNSFQVHGPLNHAARLRNRDEKLWRREEEYGLMKKLSKLMCNCNYCHGGRSWSRNVVRKHLITYGRDPTLRHVKPGPDAPSDSSDEDWSDIGRGPSARRPIGESLPPSCIVADSDEVDLGLPMAKPLNDPWQAHDAAVDESMMQTTNVDRLKEHVTLTAAPKTSKVPSVKPNGPAQCSTQTAAIEVSHVVKEEILEHHDAFLGDDFADADDFEDADEHSNDGLCPPLGWTANNGKDNVAAFKVSHVVKEEILEHHNAYLGDDFEDDDGDPNDDLCPPPGWTGNNGEDNVATIKVSHMGEQESPEPHDAYLGDDFEDDDEDSDDIFCPPPAEGTGDSGEDRVVPTSKCRKEPGESSNKYTPCQGGEKRQRVVGVENEASVNPAASCQLPRVFMPPRTLSPTQGIRPDAGPSHSYHYPPYTQYPPPGPYAPYPRGYPTYSGAQQHPYYPMRGMYPPAVYPAHGRGYFDWHPHIEHDDHSYDPEAEKAVPVNLSPATFKRLQANAARQQNRAIAKKVKMEQGSGVGEDAPKPVITVNPEGCPLVPSRNQWMAALKNHTFRFLDLTKAIDCQDPGKLEKVKENLDKQFEYTKPGLSFDHMRLTAGRLLKTRRGEWRKIYQAGGKRPANCPQHVWAELMKYWSTPDFATKQGHLINARAQVKNVSKFGRGGPVQHEARINQVHGQQPLLAEMPSGSARIPQRSSVPVDTSKGSLKDLAGKVQGIMSQGAAADQKQDQFVASLKQIRSCMTQLISMQKALAEKLGVEL